MGRYSVKVKHDLSGIATLTGNPLAIRSATSSVTTVRPQAIKTLK